MKRGIRFWLGFAAVGSLLGGCSSFSRGWRQAEAVSTDGLQGRWEGEWHSDVNQHHGKLRCIVGPPQADESGERSERDRVGPATENTGTLKARFHYWARWGPFSGSFDGVYPVERVGPRWWRFKGSSDLGMLGGVYTHEGEVNDDLFRASYRGRYDHGTMTMRRPPSPGLTNR